MAKVLIYILLFGSCLSQAWSQDFDHYKPIKAQGPIPADFLGSATEKFEASLKTIEKNTDSQERHLKERFYLESNFNIDEMLLSGRVLFNDPISNYLNQVADKILKDDPELRKKLRFYVLKSPIPNAFTTNQGIIFVNIGLFPRLDNEAQLAFIMCHEIAHYVERHVIEGYVKAAKVDLKGGKYQKSTSYEKLMLKNLYSRDHEMEADIKGFALFAKTPYSFETIPAVFDILQAADAPHLSPKVPGALFHTKDLQLDDFERYHQKMLAKKDGEAGEDELAVIEEVAKPKSKEDGEILSEKEKKRREKSGGEPEEAEEEEEENLSTHPSPQKRREAILQELIKLQPQGDQAYLVSQNTFSRVKKMANFELCDLFLQTTAFHDALHHTLALRDKYPQSSFLEFALVRALYGKAKYRLEGERHDNYMIYEEMDQEVYHLYKYSTRINRRKFAALALSYAWTYYEGHPDQLHAEKIVEDLIVDLLDDYPRLEKVKRWKKDTAVVAFFQNLKAKDAFSPVLEKCQKERERLDEFEDYKDSSEGRADLAKWREGIRKKGYRLGVDTIVVFAPLVYHVDVRKKNESPVQYISSEQKQVEFSQYIQKNAKRLKLEVIVLDNKTLTSGDISSFRDAAAVYAWYDEWIRAEVKMIPSNFGEMHRISEKYGTSHFVHMGAVSLRNITEFRDSPVAFICGSLMLLPFAPMILYWGLDANIESLTYAMVFDMDRNGPSMAYRKYRGKNLSKVELENYVHHILRQIKK